jgi:hypothetical protein
MILATTFIPSQRAKDLLCALWAEYNCCGETRQMLFDLRAEIGADEFGRFQEDMSRLMKRHCARRAVEQILRAAVLRSPHKLETTQLRTIYQPA